MDNIHIHAPPNTTKWKMFEYMHHNKYMYHIHQKKICEHTCSTYTYMHHQIPPKNKICLVDLTSELYERPDQNVSIHAPHTYSCTTKYHQKILAPPNTTKK